MGRSRGFASDNNAGVHPEVFKAMEKANIGHVIAYGDDWYTAEAKIKFKEHFGEVEVFFVFGGTAANVLSLSALTKPFNAVICSSVAHLHVDECGAPEKFTGCKLLLVPSCDGKISVEEIKPYMHGIGDQHHVQPKVISITQATEYGTVYTFDEIRSITQFAHSHNMFVHMDGARIANAAVSLGIGLREISRDAGVDVLSFGGTKNGMMYGEAVIFFNQALAENFKYLRKEGMQLASKMRFISAQFSALLSNDLWKKNAMHANKMAQLLVRMLMAVPQIKITQKVQSNAVFAVIPKHIIPRLQQEYFFYVWNEDNSEVRFMTSFDTTEDDVKSFAAFLTQAVS